MFLTKRKLYVILLIVCVAGYIWLFYSTIIQSKNSTVGVCLFKHITNIPCPSCGSTRAVIELIHGNFLQSLYINPLGILIVLIMLIVPIWILFDMITYRKTLFDFYRQAEFFFKKIKIAIPLIVLVFINWIWNIVKGL